MKFMKLGSKPDSFQSDQDSIRYVATDLATDVVINVEDVKFYLHKFPLLSKSPRLQKLIAESSSSEDDENNEIRILDIPGGPSAFEICAKFCYGMTVTLNAYNVVSARCAAEYLEMYESVETGNLVYKIEVFLNTSVLRSWKDSIIVLESTRSYYPWSEDLRIDARCLESIASKAGMDLNRVDWSYTYNTRRKVVNSINGVPRDWWIEDLAELSIDLYERAISCIRRKGNAVSSEVIGEALEVYAMKRLRIDDDSSLLLDDGKDANNDLSLLLETIVSLLPSEKQSVSVRFLFDLLKYSVSFLDGEDEIVKAELHRRIGEKLEEANVSDLLIRASDDGQEGCETVYDVDIVETLVDEFVTQRKKKKKLEEDDDDEGDDDDRFLDVVVSESSKAIVAKLIDGYLTEIARIELNLSSSKFIAIAEKVSDFPRLSHDGVYRAIDMFLKQHPEITKSEKKSICRLMDPRKLSPEACAHAVQNERLPLRVVVQILFFEQVRATCLPPTQEPTTLALVPPPGGSHGSSSQTTTTVTEEEDCDSEEMMKAMTMTTTTAMTKTTARHNKFKAKGVMMSKIFSKLWTGKNERDGQKRYLPRMITFIFGTRKQSLRIKHGEEAKRSYARTSMRINAMVI